MIAACSFSDKFVQQAMATGANADKNAGKNPSQQRGAEATLAGRADAISAGTGDRFMRQCFRAWWREMCAKNVPPPPLRVSATFWDTMGGRIVG